MSAIAMTTQHSTNPPQSPTTTGMNNQQMNSNQQGVILPGTFKSMLLPNTIGDIIISIPNIQSLNELFTNDASSSSFPPTSQSSPSVESDGLPSTGDQRTPEFPARIQLTYRQPIQGLAQQDTLLSGGPPTAFTQQLNTQPTATAPRRLTLNARGKIAVITTTKSGSCGAADSPQPPTLDVPVGETRLIRQYDMMFVQSDFETGQPFFSVTFSKTLVQQGTPGGPHTPPLSMSDRGLMLSGHYSCLRNYDLGTVRVHLPPGLLSGELAPLFSSPSTNRAAEEEELTRTGSFTPKQSFAMIPPFVTPDSPSSTFYSSFVEQPTMVQQGRPHHHHANGYTPPYHGNRSVRFCYGCGETGHLHKDCPRDQLFCYNCNQTGHSSKNCKKPKPWEQSNPAGPGMVSSTHYPTPSTSPGERALSHASSNSSNTSSGLNPQSSSFSPMKTTSPQRSLSVPDAWNLSVLQEQLSHYSPMQRYAAPPPGLNQQHQPMFPRPIGSPMNNQIHAAGSSLLFGGNQTLGSSPLMYQKQQPPSPSHQYNTQNGQGNAAVNGKTDSGDRVRCFLCGSFGHPAKTCPSFNCIEELNETE